MSYVGRFAPSPTGLLHFGSLVAALASLCDARANNGKWLVRMEDIDPPRAQAGAAEAILHSLEAHYLFWDESVLYQSSRTEAYREALAKLEQQGLSYRCTCSRRDLQGQDTYTGHCRSLHHGSDRFSAVRLNLDLALKKTKLSPLVVFDDLIQKNNPQQQNLSSEVGDFIVHRKDGLFAYQLAVVIDDIYQGITHVIRGVDLIDSTARQLLLFNLLGRKPLPVFGHIPLALNEQGQKLCKQHHAPALDNSLAAHNLYQALQFLNQHPPKKLQTESAARILEWGIEHWQINAVQS